MLIVITIIIIRQYHSGFFISHLPRWLQLILKALNNTELYTRKGKEKPGPLQIHPGEKELEPDFQVPLPH